MRAVVLEIDERMLAERSRLGLDRRDEMWEEVLHVVPPASARHQSIEFELAVALRPVVARHGWRVRAEMGVFASDEDYRVPDIVVYAPGAESERGVDGAPVLAIEIRSPRDESDAKVPWYLARGATAVLIIDRDTLVIELHTADGHVTGDVMVEPLGVRISRTKDSLAVDGLELDL